MTETTSRPTPSVPTVRRMTNAFLREAVIRWARALGGRACQPHGFPPEFRFPFLDEELRVSLFAARGVSGALATVMESVGTVARGDSCHRAIVLTASLARLDAVRRISESRRREMRLWWLFVDQFGGVVAVPPSGFVTREAPARGRDRRESWTSRRAPRSLNT